jgi:hypothetical protein
MPEQATDDAATAVERPGDAVSVARDLQFGYEIGHDEGIGEDEYVLEKNVDECNEIGIVKSNIKYDEDSDFRNEKPAFDMSYFRNNNGRRGRSLTDGGPARPDTSGMTKASAKYELKLWRKARKKYTDSLLSLKAKARKSLERDNDDNNHNDDDIEYLGVTTNMF